MHIRPNILGNKQKKHRKQFQEAELYSFRVRILISISLIPILWIIRFGVFAENIIFMQNNWKLEHLLLPVFIYDEKCWFTGNISEKLATSQILLLCFFFVSTRRFFRSDFNAKRKKKHANWDQRLAFQ